MASEKFPQNAGVPMTQQDPLSPQSAVSAAERIVHEEFKPIHDKLLKEQQREELKNSFQANIVIHQAEELIHEDFEPIHEALVHEHALEEQKKEKIIHKVREEHEKVTHEAAIHLAWRGRKEKIKNLFKKFGDIFHTSNRKTKESTKLQNKKPVAKTESSHTPHYSSLDTIKVIHVTPHDTHRKK